MTDGEYAHCSDRRRPHGSRHCSGLCTRRSRRDNLRPGRILLDTAKARILTNLKDLGEDEGAAQRVTPVADLARAVRDADYVIEAVLEDLPLKQKLFSEIEKCVRPDTILASNTSVIPITSIMEGLKYRERALGTHWWNPPISFRSSR